MENLNTIITDQPLSLDDCQSYISNTASGGNCIFLGTVRNENKNQRVLRLEFESYKSMALRELDKIGQETLSKYNCTRVYIAHRVGTVQIGEAAVIIGTSSVHRKDSFESCEFLIDILKKKIPIWKKEVYEDGSHWINAHP
jgi:molybdopterin synthase catalytic subunit